MRIDEELKAAEVRLSTSSDTASLDARLLLAHILEKDMSYLFTWPDRLLTVAQSEQLNELVARREQGEPVAYLLGKQAFWTLDLEVSPCTLIPRADTELLVETGLKLVSGVVAPKILDLGTGTGAVALAMASELSPNAAIEAVDLVEDAVALAKRNADRLGLKALIYQSCWFEQVNTSDFDLIVSNPPYIDPLDPHLVQGDVRFEPKSALTSENNGLADICIIADQARSHLKSGGWLAFEHGYDQGEAARSILMALDYQNIQTLQDLGGKDRVTMGLHRR